MCLMDVQILQFFTHGDRKSGRDRGKERERETEGKRERETEGKRERDRQKWIE